MGYKKHNEDKPSIICFLPKGTSHTPCLTNCIPYVPQKNLMVTQLSSFFRSILSFPLEVTGDVGYRDLTPTSLSYTGQFFLMVYNFLFGCHFSSPFNGGELSG